MPWIPILITVILFAALSAYLFRPRYDSTVYFCGYCEAWAPLTHIHTQDTEDAFDAGW